MALPSIVLLGLANVGCPGNNSSSTTANVGGSDGGSTDGGAGGAVGGAGGETCTPQTEICDRQDNDCDGVVDNVPGLPPEGCACNDGEQQPCYSGADGTQGVGACIGGMQDCTGGMWGACLGEIVPKDEACNLIDDDCNGTPDDMGMQSCGIGACAATVETCVAGQMQTCTPGQPTLEVCDGIDNNCNQLIDETDPMVGAACMTGNLGPCAQGQTVCKEGALSCATDVVPLAEVCDGVDNDCSGVVDDNVPGTGGACSTGQLGVCQAGTISCQLSGGSYQIDCFPNTPQSGEICDGLDNDCDGTVDDGNPGGGMACDTGQLGICQAGTLNCVSGAVQCTPNAQAAMETCDGIDNNCDGQVDEGNPGGGVGCGCGGAGVTACQAGALVCNGGPATYFTEDFSDNGAGWTLGPEWAINPAVASSCGSSSTGNDPGTDHTPTADNGVAGVLIGGCYPTTLHGDYCITSPNINTSAAPGSVWLSYWRHLHSDYPSFITNRVDVSSNGGASWNAVWTHPSGTFINDLNWTQQSFDVTAYKSASFRVRFCYAAGSSGIITGGGWSVDDVAVASAVCP